MAKLKGIEGLPLKYMLTLIVAAIIMAAFFIVLNQFSTTAMALTQSTNNTLHDVLANSLSRALK